jgi:hypothetical protein
MIFGIYPEIFGFLFKKDVRKVAWNRDYCFKACILLTLGRFFQRLNKIPEFFRVHDKISKKNVETLHFNSEEFNEFKERISNSQFFI